MAYVMGMSSKKLYRWYMEVLSGFSQAKETGEIDKNNIKVKEKGGLKEIKIPIMEEKNMGEDMGIDEKTINGISYTILSNRKTNKIALMASTLKTSHLMKIILKFDIETRMKVKSLTRDMASNYDWLGRQAFMNAYHVVDKFHVLTHVMEQLQAIRIRYRQEELRKRRIALNNKQKYVEHTFENGDTTLQLLARSRGSLFLFTHQWSQQQEKRANVLFNNYPEIHKAYLLVKKLRVWFAAPLGKTTYQKTRTRKKQELLTLIKELMETKIEELKNIAFMLKKNSAQILNYFIAKETNAKAEALNQNLQRFINVNYGARNTDFFLFRVKTYFA